MFQPREIVYGFVKGINPPHHKYIVTIYQDEELSIVACFTTSQGRAGVPEDKITMAPFIGKRSVSPTYSTRIIA